MNKRLYLLNPKYVEKQRLHTSQGNNVGLEEHFPPGPDGGSESHENLGARNEADLQMNEKDDIAEEDQDEEEMKEVDGQMEETKEDDVQNR